VGYIKLSSYVVPEINVEAQLKYTKWYYEGEWTYLEDAAPWEPPAGTVVPSTYNDHKWGFTLKSSYRPSPDLSVVGGVDYYHVTADYTFIAFQPIIYVHEWAPFINAEYRIGSLSLHAGTRYDYNSSFGSQVSPSVGAAFNFLKSTLIRVNVARTFKVPPQMVYSRRSLL
jgi:outer membrane receptor protein involved in Fe transport